MMSKTASLKNKGAQAAILLGALSLVAAGCANAEGSDEGASGGGGDEIVIGVSVPLTGTGASAGKAIGDAATIAADFINEDGGIDGKNLKIEVVDNRGEASECANAAQKIGSSDAVAMIGAYFSACTLASIPVANKSEIPLIVETSSAVDITTPEVAGDWVFRISPNSDLDTLALVQFLEDAGHDSVFFLSENTDFGLGAEESYTKAMNQLGIEIAGRANFNIDAQRFSSQVTAAIDSGADAWIVTSEVQQTAQILKDRHGQGGTAEVYTSGGSANPEELVDLAGADAAAGLLGTIYFPPFQTDALTQPELADRLLAEWEERDLYLHSITEGARGFAAVQTIAAALEDADDVTSRDSVREALLDVEIDTVIYGHVKFIDNCGLVRQNEPIIYLSKIEEDGSVSVVAESKPPYGCLE